MESFDLALVGGTLLTPWGKVQADIGVAGGKIARMGDLTRARAGERLCIRGLHLLPGAIDTQVHFREPGATHKEDLESGSRGAILGGVTSVFEMPNTDPPTTDIAALHDKFARAEGRMHCDYAFYFGATAHNGALQAEAEQIQGCAGVKIFAGSSTGDLLVDTPDGLMQALESGRRRVAVHSESEPRLLARKALRRANDPASHALWRDVESARESTERIIALARQAGRRIHVLHVSTQEELPLLAAARDIASAEVTPQHLTLDESACVTLGARAQMNPPLRAPRHAQALFAALREGLFDVMGSDHAPHTQEEKARAYPNSPSGMPGVQTMLPVMLDHVNAGRLSLERLTDLLAHGPQRLFGLAEKGRIAMGWDADFAIVDMGVKRRIENGWIASRCGWTPFDGRKVRGWVVGTILRGRRVMWEGDMLSPPSGKRLRFLEASL